MILDIHSHSIHEWHIYLNLPWNSTISCRSNIYHTMDGVGYIFSWCFFLLQILLASQTTFFLVTYGLAWPSLARNGLENACQAPNPLGNGYAPGARWTCGYISRLDEKMKNRGFSKRDGLLNFGFFGCRMGKGHERTPKQIRSMSNFLELLTRQARSESHPKPAKTKGGKDHGSLRRAEDHHDYGWSTYPPQE